MDKQTDKAASVRLQPPSRFGGGRLPVGTGRPKGSQNKITKTIREAVELAARQVTDKEGRKGLAYWLLERANGGVADRQIFAAMMAKALPLTINGNGTGGVTINLGWLSGRDIGGTLTVQPTPNALIEHDDNRTINPSHAADPAIDQEIPTADPQPPLNRQGGEGS
jgi:hypothetical protein